MMISTRGRYALRVLIDLAEHRNGSYLPLKEIANRQEISLKYMEQVMGLLSQNGLVDTAHGKGGGYRLNRDPADYRVSDILRITEGSLAPVACLEGTNNSCARASECRTLPLWEKLYKAISDCLDKVTLADLMQSELPENYVI